MQSVINAEGKGTHNLVGQKLNKVKEEGLFNFVSRSIKGQTYKQNAQEILKKHLEGVI